MAWFKPKTLLDNLFEGSIILKGVDSLLQLVGGLLLLEVKPETITGLVAYLTRYELSQDPNDFIANHLWNATHHLNSKFGAIYLLSHGLVKLVLVIALLKNRLWAYPAMEGVLLIFIAYQSYRFGYTHSISMLVLTIFDLLVVWLTWREYHKQRVIGGVKG